MNKNVSHKKGKGGGTTENMYTMNGTKIFPKGHFSINFFSQLTGIN